MSRDDGSVLKALNNHLNVFVQSRIPVVEVSYFGKAFNPPKDEIWLKQNTMFAPPMIIGAFSDASQYREHGIYQVSVYSPIGDGEIAPSVLAGLIQDHFKRGTILTSGGINVKVESSYRTSAITEQSWVVVPVSIEFWFYTA